jgi:hypothetical protein
MKMSETDYRGHCTSSPALCTKPIRALAAVGEPLIYAPIAVQTSKSHRRMLVEEDYELLDDLEIEKRLMFLKHQIPILTEAAEYDRNDDRQSELFDTVEGYIREEEALQDELNRRNAQENLYEARQEARKEAREFQARKSRRFNETSNSFPAGENSPRTLFGYQVTGTGVLPQETAPQAEAGPAFRKSSEVPRFPKRREAKRHGRKQRCIRIVIEY